MISATIQRFIGVALGVIIAQTAHSEEADFFGKCSDVPTFFELAPGVFGNPDVMLLQLEKEYGTRHVFFVGIGMPDIPPPANWFLISRKDESSEYCVVGVGLMIEILASLHGSA